MERYLIFELTKMYICNRDYKEQISLSSLLNQEHLCNLKPILALQTKNNINIKVGLAVNRAYRCLKIPFFMAMLDGYILTFK